MRDEYAVRRDCEDHGTDTIPAPNRSEAETTAARLRDRGVNAHVVTRHTTEWQTEPIKLTLNPELVQACEQFNRAVADAIPHLTAAYLQHVGRLLQDAREARNA